VDGAGSEWCPMAEFGISGVDTSVSAVKEFVN
jgi:hypothetical protein